MNIVSPSIKQFNNYFIAKPQQKNIFVQNPVCLNNVFAKPTNQNYQAYALSFGSILKKKDAIDYSKRDAYISHMDNKITKMMKNRSKAEVSAMVKSIATKNKVDEKDVLKVLTRVVQFTSYSQMPKIYEGMKKKGANRLYSMQSPNYSDINNLFIYVGYKKKQMMDSYSGANRVFGLFLDSYTAQHLKDLRDGLDPIEFSKIKRDVDNGEIKLFVIDGWNTKIKNKDMSYGAFGAQYDLETVVDAIVSEQKKTNKSLDEIFNGDIIEEAKDIFGQNVEVNVIKNPSSKKATLTQSTDLLTHKAPGKEYIRGVLDAYTLRPLDKYSYSKEERNMWVDILSQYYDSALSMYSPESLNDEMKILYSKIEKIVHKMGKSMKDVVYLIPNIDKSFELINYQYAKVNNIPIKQFLYHDGLSGLKESDYGKVNLNGKIAVVLDDFAGSGESLVQKEFFLSDYMSKDKKRPIIIGSVFSLKEGVDNIKKHMKNYPNAHYITNGVFDFDKDFMDKLSDKKQRFIEKLGMQDAVTLFSERGYKNGAGCVSFPYMLPDNNLSYSNLLLNYTNNKKINNKSNNSQFMLDLVKHTIKNRRNKQPYDKDW